MGHPLELSIFENNFIEEWINQYYLVFGEKVLFKSHILSHKKGGNLESKWTSSILIITNYHFLLFSEGKDLTKKPPKDHHIYDCKKVTSKMEYVVSFTFQNNKKQKSKVILKSDQINNIISLVKQLRISLDGEHCKSDLQFNIKPNVSKLTITVPKKEGTVYEEFISIYNGWCSYFNSDPHPIVYNYIQKLIVNSNNEINLNEIQQSEGSELTLDYIPFFNTLRHNDFFNSLIIKELKKESQVKALSDLLLHNSQIKKLILKKSGNDSLHSIFLSLSLNKRNSIQILDISENILSTKSISSLVNCLTTFNHSLIYLNLSNCGIPSKQMSQLFESFEKNFGMSLTLEYLNISFNKLDEQANLAFISWILKSRSNLHLKTLILNSVGITNLTLQSLKYLPKLEHLDISHNKLDLNDLERLFYILSIETLYRIDCNYCNLPKELVSIIFNKMSIKKINVHIEMAGLVISDDWDIMFNNMMVFKDTQISICTLRLENSKCTEKSILMLLNTCSEIKIQDLIIDGINLSHNLTNTIYQNSLTLNSSNNSSNTNNSSSSSSSSTNGNNNNSNSTGTTNIIKKSIKESDDFDSLNSSGNSHNNNSLSSSSNTTTNNTLAPNSNSNGNSNPTTPTNSNSPNNSNNSLKTLIQNINSSISTTNNINININNLNFINNNNNNIDNFDDLKSFQNAFIKCLQKIYFNNEIKCLSLSGIGRVIKWFLPTLAKSSSVAYLDISSNSLSDQGAISLAKALTENRSLESIHFDSNQITNIGWSTINSSIRLETTTNCTQISTTIVVPSLPNTPSPSSLYNMIYPSEDVERLMNSNQSSSDYENRFDIHQCLAKLQMTLVSNSSYIRNGSRSKLLFQVGFQFKRHDLFKHQIQSTPMILYPTTPMPKDILLKMNDKVIIAIEPVNQSTLSSINLFIKDPSTRISNNHPKYRNKMVQYTNNFSLPSRNSPIPFILSIPEYDSSTNFLNLPIIEINTKKSENCSSENTSTIGSNSNNPSAPSTPNSLFDSSNSSSGVTPQSSIDEEIQSIESVIDYCFGFVDDLKTFNSNINITSISSSSNHSYQRSNSLLNPQTQKVISINNTSTSSLPSLNGNSSGSNISIGSSNSSGSNINKNSTSNLSPISSSPSFTRKASSITNSASSSFNNGSPSLLSTSPLSSVSSNSDIDDANKRSRSNTLIENALQDNYSRSSYSNN